MMYLILRRIRNTSEQAIESLRNRITRMKLRDIEGENVDIAVSLIKTTHQALVSASTPTHSFVPDDFPKVILQVLQTSSVDSFNEVFAGEEQDAQIKADKTGTLPIWPSISQLTLLATNTYQRMLTSGVFGPALAPSKRQLSKRSQ